MEVIILKNKGQGDQHYGPGELTEIVSTEAGNGIEVKDGKLFIPGTPDAAEAFKPAVSTDAPSETNTTNLTTTVVGDRAKLLGKPTSWGEVKDADGNVYLFPLYSKT